MTASPVNRALVLRDAIRLISLGRGFRYCRPVVRHHRVGGVYGEKPHRQRGQRDRAQRADNQGHGYGVWRPPGHKHSPRARLGVEKPRDMRPIPEYD